MRATLQGDGDIGKRIRVKRILPELQQKGRASKRKQKPEREQKARCESDLPSPPWPRSPPRMVSHRRIASRSILYRLSLETRGNRTLRKWSAEARNSLKCAMRFINRFFNPSVPAINLNLHPQNPIPAFSYVSAISNRRRQRFVDRRVGRWPMSPKSHMQ